ncbi:hypothetical protein HaLaN_25776 [Haematococcus lacustris]|uniref:Uncharacterized protein n=1 Tax=Haematococcus lacustris TaxID=44745 RepID=A0A6A0A494_HAELA|nr:hypothetical protein HaLaN_25776 [Haematococcus lacustris]
MSGMVLCTGACRTVTGAFRDRWRVCSVRPGGKHRRGLLHPRSLMSVAIKLRPKTVLKQFGPQITHLLVVQE